MNLFPILANILIHSLQLYILCAVYLIPTSHISRREEITPLSIHINFLRYKNLKDMIHIYAYNHQMALWGTAQTNQINTVMSIM